jgi:hypothetical protein
MGTATADAHLTHGPEIVRLLPSGGGTDNRGSRQGSISPSHLGLLGRKIDARFEFPTSGMNSHRRSPVRTTEAPEMNGPAAFIVRCYPPFRMARLYRVYVDQGALYLIRMRGVIGNADAGSRFELHPGRRAAGMFLRWWASKSLDTSARELDARGPREMLDAHRMNLRVEPGEVAESRLDPPRVLGHGEHFACWSLNLQGRRRLSFQIEDEASLRTALEHLPRLLGPALCVSVALDEPSGQPRRVKETPRR